MAEVDADGLLKIGALAKAAGVTVPTIQYWTSEGLLEVAEITASGYQLYSPGMVDPCLIIRNNDSLWQKSKTVPGDARPSQSQIKVFYFSSSCNERSGSQANFLDSQC